MFHSKNCKTQYKINSFTTINNHILNAIGKEISKNAIGQIYGSNSHIQIIIASVTAYSHIQIINNQINDKTNIKDISANCHLTHHQIFF